jgi:predicted CopG family antitoxin
MGTKTISLADDAYAGLASMRRPGESFSDVVRRLTRRTSLLDLAGTLPPEAAQAVAAAVEANRNERLDRRARRLGTP